MNVRLIPKFILPALSLSARIIYTNGVQTLSHNKTFYAVNCRTYAKNKDRGKDKKNKNTKIIINTSIISQLVPVDRFEEKCINTLEKMKEDFAQHLSLRSTTGAIESLVVKFEGKSYELQELAQIVRKNPKTIVISFSSFPQAIPDALKAIYNSGLNLNPQQDGTTVFIPVPKVTKEHREALAKNAKALFIKCRDTLKIVQNEFTKKAKQNTNVSEDLVFDVIKQLGAMSERHLAEAQKIYDTKCEELLGKDK